MIVSPRLYRHGLRLVFRLLDFFPCIPLVFFFFYFIFVHDFLQSFLLFPFFCDFVLFFSFFQRFFFSILLVDSAPIVRLSEPKM